MSKANRETRTKLFGTDGIRSAFGEYPLDGASIIKLGEAVGRCMGKSRIVIGRDTRRSGEEIVWLLASGMGGNVELIDCGVIPTPGLSFITDRGDFDYGIMITASHNPWGDNGIKIFNGNGEKLDDSLEQELETAFFNIEGPATRKAAAVPVDNSAGAVYVDFLLKEARRLDRQQTEKFKVVLDCANGAGFEAAPVVFAGAGFDLDVINNRPDGRNINLGCGSTDMGMLTRRVKEVGANLGIAFDGDADRVLMVDALGNMLDGDHTLYLIAQYLLETDSTFNKVVVGTVMGNLGLEKALNEMGLTYVRTAVGDRHVYEEMKRRESILGGEQSGHTILRACRKTGDGILTALYFLRALFYIGITPTRVYERLRLYPQAMKSIKIREKRKLEEWEELQGMVASFNGVHGKNSRVLIRYSGTEPKLRVMIESEDESVIGEYMSKFEELIKSTIGT